MKTKTLLVIVVSSIVILAGVIAAAAQGPKPLGPLHAAAVAGTGFTYQGQLKRSGAPVNAQCDFVFALYDAQGGGSQIGGNLPATISVTNGLFTAVLDFGAGTITGDARWLDIQVRCPTGVGVYAPLTPRQALTPAPMALALPGLWTQQNGLSPNLIGGYSGNVISPSLVAATIGGGGLFGYINLITATGNYATIGGGAANTASGFEATVGGGYNNTASGFEATVGGGASNSATFAAATVGGGANNSASASSATVGGGYVNTAVNFAATVGGGTLNTAASNAAMVGGGDSNTASANYATVSGGYSNTATSAAATVGGGATNLASANYATVGGGINNIASGQQATVGGGYSNTSTSAAATVGGGTSNTAGNFFATVGGGSLNTATSYAATVGGGYINLASDSYATVGGGTNNTAAYAATVAGGTNNTASGQQATVGGGVNNVASGGNSTVVGGDNNSASMPNSLAAGHRAQANHQGAFVWADSANTNFASTGSDQFLIRAAGGAGILDSGSSLDPGGAQLMVASAGTIATPQVFITQTTASDYARLRLGQSGSSIPWDIAAGGASDVLNFYHNGNLVTIGTGGILTASGGFSGQCLTDASSPFNTNTNRACNMDVAEAFASADRTEPGDVVALVSQPDGGNSPAAGPTVHKAGRADGTLVVGVVSSNPGLVFDNGQTHLAGDNSQLITADRTVVALVGRVPVKVSLENGPIAVGDPLTGASATGTAMKATQAGQIIGYALQSSNELSDGKLLAWLQPGLYVPPQQVAQLNANTAQVSELQTRNTALEARASAAEQQNASLTARMTALEQARAAGNDIPITWLLFGATMVLAAVAWRKQ